MERDDAMPVSAEDRIGGAIPSPREPVDLVPVDVPSWAMPVASTPPTMSWLTTTTDPAIGDEAVTSDSVEPPPDPIDVPHSPVAVEPPSLAYTSPAPVEAQPIPAEPVPAQPLTGPAFPPPVFSTPADETPVPAPTAYAPAADVPAAYGSTAYAPPADASPAYGSPAYAPAAYPQPAYPPTAYAPVGFAQPPVNQPQSAPAYATAGPSLYPATAYPAAAPSPWPGPPAVTTATPKERTPGRGRRALLATVLALLLVVAGGQAYMLKRTNDRLDAANRARASADAIAANQINTLTTRATQLESQLKAQLDPVAVAARIAPSVWEIDVGDFLGTAWAVRKSPGGGTDLITNYHVVESTYKNGGRSVDLVRDKQRMHATVVKAVKANDVALVHVSQDLPVLSVSTSAVVAGEAVLAEGTPLGWQSSVSTGVVSNVSRRVHTPNGTITYFQFDAGINPGNSGGPVVDAAGGVGGRASAGFIVTEIDAPAQSMSLAIPITTACQALAAC